MSKISRSQFVELAGETAIALAVGACGFRVYPQVRNTYYVINGRHELAPSGEIEQLREMMRLASPVAESSKNLYNVYRTEYYRSHPTVSIDSKGNIQIGIEWDWENPERFRDNGIDNGVIEGWSTKFELLGNTCNNLLQVKRPFYIMTKDDLLVQERTYNGTVESLLALASYGIPLLGFVGYEELFDKFGLRIGSRRYDQGHEISRRTFLKVCTMALSGAATAPLQTTHLRAMTEARKRTDEKVSEVLASLNISPEQEFNLRFGLSPEDYIFIGPDETLSTKCSSIAQRIRAGEIYEGDGSFKRFPPEEVTYGFEDLAEKHGVFSENWRNFFENGVPRDLGIFLRSYRATNQIKSFVSSQQIGHYINPLVEGAVMSGVFAAIMGGYEYLSERNR